MCNKKNLPNRVEKANAAQKFAQVIQRDRNDKIKSIIIPGSNGKRYQVIIRRGKNGLSTELLLLQGNHGYVKPDYTKQITYHQMATVQMAANESGYKISWCANRDDAIRLAKLGGKVFRFRNFDNLNSVMYGVMKSV